jgi:hypothetical protein
MRCSDACPGAGGASLVGRVSVLPGEVLQLGWGQYRRDRAGSGTAPGGEDGSNRQRPAGLYPVRRLPGCSAGR